MPMHSLQSIVVVAVVVSANRATDDINQPSVRRPSLSHSSEITRVVAACQCVPSVGLDIIEDEA